MGSLTSRPNLPQVQQQPVIFTVPAPPPVSASSVVTQTQQPARTSVSQAGADDNSVPVEGSSNEEAQRLAREDNLLRRSRGRLGTVLTGFSGVLSQAVGKTARKTLLGE